MKTRDTAQLETDTFAQERKELDAVLESGIFAVSSNAAKLLRFVCEKHFHRAAENITEYDVAIQALGRRADFDPQRDSIVRVEAHRVRKRLQEYYAAEGASNAVKIVLTRGHYAPCFVYSESAPKPKVEPPVGLEPAPPPPTRWWRTPTAIGILLIAGITLVSWRLATRGIPIANRSAQPVVAAGADTVRILAGLDSGEYLDRSGARWSADAYYAGGTSSAVRYYSLALADDPAIYQHARTGENFSYDIPLRPGVYEMRFMFAESAEVAILGSVGDGTRSFHVAANGVQILPPPDGHHMSEFDVVADAGGPNTADVKVFKNISPAPDGKLHLRFTGRSRPALLNAIEIVPGTKGKMRPLRWRANETPYTDHAGNLWLADRYFRGGRLSRFHAVVSRTPDPDLYEGERFGSFTYSVPVVADATYTAQLDFAENYFGGWTTASSRPRVFSVYANHRPLLTDFNIAGEAGGPVISLTKTFRGLKPNAFDKIVLSFEPTTEFATINAIAVEDESR
jgi:hypothetical protein